MTVNINIWAPTEDIAWDLKNYIESFKYVHDNAKVVFWNQKDNFRLDSLEFSTNVVLTWDLPADKDTFEVLRGHGIMEGIKDIDQYGEFTLSQYLQTRYFGLPKLTEDGDLYSANSTDCNEVIFLPNIKEEITKDDFQLSDYLDKHAVAERVINAIFKITMLHKALNVKQLNVCSY